MGLKSSDVLHGLVVVGAIAKPKLGMQPKPFGEACTPPGKTATPPSAERDDS